MNEEDAEPLHSDELAGIDPTGGLGGILVFGSPETRRYFLKQVAGTSVAISLGPALMGIGSVEAAESTATPGIASAVVTKFQLKINGKEHTLEVDPRTTLLDALREHLQMTGSKKG